MASSGEDELIDEKDLPQVSQKRKASLAPDVEDNQDKNGLNSLSILEKSGEKRLSLKAANARTEVQLWLMGNIPTLMGLEFSDEMPAEISEDGQNAFLDKALDGANVPAEATLSQLVDDTFASTASARPGYAQFKKDLVSKVLDVSSVYVEAKSQSKELPGVIAEATSRSVTVDE